MALFNHVLLLTIFLTTVPAISMQKYDQNYLNSKPFKQRLEIAAKWIGEDCDLVIDLGGGHNSIAHYIAGPEVIVIDPVLNKSRQEGSVTYIKREYQFWRKDQDAAISNKKFALVIMGLQLEHMQGNDWQSLFKLGDRSQKIIVEYSVNFPDAKKQFENIRAGVNKKITKETEFDFSNDFSEKSHVPVYRRMVLFENVEDGPSSSEKNNTSDELNELGNSSDLEKIEHY